MAGEERGAAECAVQRQSTRPMRSVATGPRGLDFRERFACGDGWHFPHPLERSGNSRRWRELRRAAFVR